MLQFFGGFAGSHVGSVAGPSGAPQPALKTIRSGGIGTDFDWRWYL